MKFPKDRVAAQTMQRTPVNPWFSTINPNFRNLKEYYDNLISTQVRDAWVGPPRFGTIAATTTAAPVVISITGYRFVALALVGMSDLPDFILVTIRDLSTGNTMMNNPISLRNLVGTGATPDVLNVPRIFENGTRLEFTLQNSNTGSDSSFSEIAFHGIRMQVV